VWAEAVAVVEAGVAAGAAAGVEAVEAIVLLAGVVAVEAIVLLAVVVAVAIAHHLLLVEGDSLWGTLLPFLGNRQGIEGEGIEHQLHPMAIGRRTDTKLNFRMEFCKEDWQTAQGR